MPPSSTCPYNQQNRYTRIFTILAATLLVTGQGCREGGGSQGVENLKRERSAKPEGILTAVRKLDLGTMPLNGRMELLISVKNPTSRTITVTSYEVEQSGLKLRPANFEIEPSEKVPVTIDVTTEATKVPGIHEWDIAAKTAEGELAFRTTLQLIVKDNEVVLDNDMKDPRVP
jgi:hypothetical protein